MCEIVLTVNGAKAFDLRKLDEVLKTLGLPDDKDAEVLNHGKILIWEDDRYESPKDFDKAEALKNLEPYIIKKSSSHYDWLDDNLDDFWVKVFGIHLKDSHFCGIISAHGDKAYQYRTSWEEAGIPFNHGVALFFLTYTNLMDEEKHLSKDWVIKNYPKYKPLLNEDY